MQRLISILSLIIILLGVVHTVLAFPLSANHYNLWFVGAGMSVVFSGLLNLVAVHRGGSPFSKAVAIVVNLLGCAMFAYALAVLREPQVYVGIVLYAGVCLSFFIFKPSGQ